MPLTFFFVIGFIIYFYIVGFTPLICGPLLLIKKERLFAKKVLSIVLISFPSLILVTIIIGAFLAPIGLFFLPLTDGVTLENRIIIVFLLVELLSLLIVIATSALYVWQFLSRLIISYLDKKPLEDFYTHDKVYQYLDKMLIKFKLL